MGSGQLADGHSGIGRGPRGGGRSVRDRVTFWGRSTAACQRHPRGSSRRGLARRSYAHVRRACPPAIVLAATPLVDEDSERTLNSINFRIDDAAQFTYSRLVRLFDGNTRPEKRASELSQIKGSQSYFQKLWTAATTLSGFSFSVDEHDAVDQVL